MARYYKAVYRKGKKGATAIIYSSLKNPKLALQKRAKKFKGRVISFERISKSKAVKLGKPAINKGEDVRGILRKSEALIISRRKFRR